MGALSLDRVEPEAVLSDGGDEGINARKKNRASDLIENFMVAANGVMARALQAAKVSSIRRVVKTPERWPRIVELAAQHGGSLPAEPIPGRSTRSTLRAASSFCVQFLAIASSCESEHGQGCLPRTDLISLCVTVSETGWVWLSSPEIRKRLCAGVHHWHIAASEARTRPAP